MQAAPWHLHRREFPEARNKVLKEVREEILKVTGGTGRLLPA